jgi:FkbM family methyltransferase
MNRTISSRPEHSLVQIGIPLRVLGMAMRHMPTDIRRFGMLWEVLYQSIGGGGYEDNPEIDSRWPKGLQPPIRGTQHGQLMLLDLSVWPERREFFSGRYYQQEICRLFEAMLRAGDQYLDIGANIGMTTLLAARLIGATGIGLVFEPNPRAFARLAEHVRINRLTRITAFPDAVSSEESIAQLVVARGNSGLGSLAPAADCAGESFEVKTVTQNLMVDRLNPRESTFIKIDVEGYEVNVLRGISEILSWPEVAVVAEISEEMLQNAGHSRADLHEIMSSHGFVAHEFALIQHRWQRELQVRRLGEPKNEPKYDALFAKPASAFYARRIAPLLRA